MTIKVVTENHGRRTTDVGRRTFSKFLNLQKFGFPETFTQEVTRIFITRTHAFTQRKRWAVAIYKICKEIYLKNEMRVIPLRCCYTVKHKLPSSYPTCKIRRYSISLRVSGKFHSSMSQDQHKCISYTNTTVPCIQTLRFPDSSTMT